MIEINKLHKSYNMGSSSLHVLKGIDFKVEDGELVAIMGSSGSGKSRSEEHTSELQSHS